MVASSDGVHIASYLLQGSGAEPPADSAPPEVLLAHANGFCAAVFAPLVDHLAGRSGVAFDARAHGGSSGAGGRLDWHAHCDDLLAVHDRWGLERPLGIGHSMGGAALLLAEQRRPGTFRGLWLFEPIVFPPGLAPPEGGNPLEAGALRRRATFESRGAAYSNYASKPPLDELSAEALAAYVQFGFDEDPDGSVTLACAPEDEATGYRTGPHHGAWDGLDRVKCPVLVVRGAPGAMPGPADFAPAVADQLPDATLEDHPDLGHFGPLQAPEVAAESVLAFSSRLG
ncbi:MAG: alpha/beta fold hydrolase [Microthrixaceae bacterium]